MAAGPSYYGNSSRGAEQTKSKNCHEKATLGFGWAVPREADMISGIACCTESAFRNDWAPKYDVALHVPRPEANHPAPEVCMGCGRSRRRSRDSGVAARSRQPGHGLAGAGSHRDGHGNDFWQRSCPAEFSAWIAHSELLFHPSDLHLVDTRSPELDSLRGFC